METTYSKRSVVSADGTVVGYRQMGGGPAVVLVHGSMLAAQHLTELAAALADEFTVIVPDRRGRGLSGPHGPDFGIEREVEDLQALMKEAGAARVFGLSSGALVALRTAAVTPAIEKLALYEPPLSVNGSVPVAWAARYRREIVAGRTAAALATVLKGLQVEPAFNVVPRFALVPLLTLGLRAEQNKNDVPMADLIPTMSADLGLVEQVADTTKDYAAVDAEVLLLEGSKSPAYFGLALDELSAVLPRSSRRVLPKLDHSAPTDGGKPEVVADVLRGIFSPA